MADAVKMNVPHVGISARVYLKDVSREKLPLLQPFEGVVIDKENLDDKGKAEREKMQKMFRTKVDISSTGTSTHNEIEHAGVNVLGLGEYEILLKKIIMK